MCCQDSRTAADGRGHVAECWQFGREARPLLEQRQSNSRNAEWRGMAVTAKSSNRYHTVCLSFTGAGMTEIYFAHVANALAGILQLVLVLAPAVSTVVGSPVGAVLPQDAARGRCLIINPAPP